MEPPFDGKGVKNLDISNSPHFLIKICVWRTQLHWFLPQQELAYNDYRPNPAHLPFLQTKLY